jgi:plastocyanin
MSRPLTAVLVIVAATLAAGCGGPPRGNAAAAAADVVIVAEDMVFVDPPRRLPAGTVTLGLDNRGRAVHDLTFAGPPGRVVRAAGGRQAAAAVTLEPGTYVVYCDVSGHRRAGMEFEVEVR